LTASNAESPLDKTNAIDLHFKLHEFPSPLNWSSEHLSLHQFNQ